MLIHFGVIPYMVFDGDYLPSKAVTEVDRAKRREESKRKGLELYRLNKPSQAHLELQKAVDVTPEMARQLIDELKKIGVQYVVAPYEADAQLVYLERKGVIQGMLSEDSDLLVFGAKQLLTKLDQYGDCVEINRSDFTACREISLVGWSDVEFRRMAILSGCDYLASINKMGLKTAYRYVRKYKTIERILQMLAFDGQYHIPIGYLEKFHKAELTFLHQRVFCPEKNDVVMMTELASEAQPDDFSFIGAEVQQDVAVGVAEGDLDPMTKQPILVKNAITHAPKTPWGNSRRSTVDTPSTAKAGKSIDSFFKAKRTPLAELDPNSFTPSPTQERLLQRANGVSWSSSPAPARAPALRSSTLVHSAAPRPALSTSTSQPNKNLGADVPWSHPSKRQRLCVDSQNSQDSRNPVSLEAIRSPFFGAVSADPSPSMRTNRKNKKAKEAEITIWSDDSIEDAMAELPHVVEISAGAESGKLEVLQDDSQQGPEESTWTEIRESHGPEDDSQSSTASRGTEVSHVSLDTQASSVTSSVPSVAQTLDNHVAAELTALAAAYAYQPGTDKLTSQPDKIRRSVGCQISTITTQLAAEPHLRQQRSMTPLQRLGAGALNRSKTCTNLFDDKLSNAEVISDHKAYKVSPKLPESVPTLPVARTFGPDASAIKGSEDAIIPDSEDNADDALSEVEEEEVKSKMDFGRFAFAG
jgi:exonuclease-1